MIKAKFNNQEQCPILQSQLLLQEAGIEHFCSMRGFEHAGENVWMPRQVHGVEITVADEAAGFDPMQPLQPIEADAVITRQPGRWIGVRTADCVPLLMYDPVRKVVAAVHAGWRGTVRHIAQIVMQRLERDFGVSPSDVRVMIGPSISAQAYEVGEEVAQQFVDAGRGDCVVRSFFSAQGRCVPYLKPHIDLWQSNCMDLLEVGVELEHLDCTPWCTKENADLLFSARVQGIETGRIVSAIRLKA